MRVRKRPAKDSIDYAKYTRGRWPPVARLLRAEWDFVMDIVTRSGVAHGERQDVVLEVFLRYHQYRWNIASPMAIRGWLRTTAIHVAADMKNRKTSRYEVPFDPDELEPENLAPSPEEELSAREGHHDLMKLIDALEPARREVFFRYADQHQAMSLLSSELGIPQGTAYNRLRLAREELRAALEREAQVKERVKNRRGFAVASFLMFLREGAGRRLRELGQGLRRWLASGVGASRWVQILAPMVAVGAAVGLFPGLFPPERGVPSLADGAPGRAGAPSASSPSGPPLQTGTLAAREGEEEQAVSRPQGESGAQGESSAQIVTSIAGGARSQPVSEPARGTAQIVSGTPDSPSRLPPSGAERLPSSESGRLPPSGPERLPTSTGALAAAAPGPGLSAQGVSGPGVAGRTGLQRGPLRLAHARLVAFAKRNPPSPYPEVVRPPGALPWTRSPNSL